MGPSVLTSVLSGPLQLFICVFFCLSHPTRVTEPPAWTVELTHGDLAVCHQGQGITAFEKGGGLLACFFMEHR